MKKLLVVGVVVALVTAGILVPILWRDGGEHSAIEDTIRGYVETYNAQDYAQCLTYFTDYGDEADAVGALEFFRSLSGELEYRQIKDIAISGQIATATVVFVIGGEEATDQMQLKKVNGKWKIIWKQEALTGESAAIGDTVGGYLAAYNAGDFAGCLNYLTGFGDEQEATDSLSLIKEQIGNITFRGIGSVDVTGETATADVDYVFWGGRFSHVDMSFRKEAGVWKIAWGQLSAPATVQRLIPDTVEIAPDLSGVVEAKHFVLEAVADGAYPGGGVWEAWQVRNAGAQTLYLNIAIEYYNEDGSFWGGGGGWRVGGGRSYLAFSGSLGPDEVRGSPLRGGISYNLGDGPSYCKLIIESAG